MRTLYMNLIGSEKRIAVEEDGNIVEFLLQRSYEEDIVGNIYAGRVVNVLPGMQAAFIDIGFEKHAFLRKEDWPLHREGATISELLHEGQQIIVQVVKEAMDGKGPRLTGKIELTGNYAVFMPFDSMSAVSRKITDEQKRRELLALSEGGGFIFRSACGDVSIESVIEEMKQLRDTYERLKKENEQRKAPILLRAPHSFFERLFRDIPRETIQHVIIDDRASMKEIASYIEKEKISCYSGAEALFAHYGVQSELEKALKKTVWLSNGAYLLIETMETMTVIDVNTGKFTGKQSLQDTVRKTNELAAIEIARQLRLRDIGGMVLIDFINMKDASDKEAVRQKLIAALRKDGTPSKVLSFTALGILEMTRKNKRKSLRGLLLAPCHCCNGTGRFISARTAAFELQRELLQYNRADYEAVLVACASAIWSVFLEEQLEKSLAFHVYMSPVAHGYSIRHFGTKQDVQQRLQKEH